MNTSARRLRAVLACVLLLVSASFRVALAAPVELTFAKAPDSVTVVSSNPPLKLTHAPDSPNKYVVEADPAAPPVVQATLAGYDDMFLRLSLKSAYGQSGWFWTSVNASGEVIRNNPTFADDQPLRNVKESPCFWKTIRIDGWADRPAWLESHVPSQEKIEFGGQSHDVVPMQSLAPGTFIYPNAPLSGLIVLTRPAFNPATIKVADGELAQKDTLALPSFSPRYGPFSYWQVDVALVAGLLGWGGWWFLIKRPRVQRKEQEAQQRFDLAAQIVEKTTDMDDPHELPPLLGQTLTGAEGGSFVVLTLLGQGGMGAVFDAVSTAPDRNPDEHWAVKVLFADVLADPEVVERFDREIAMTARINHPGIVHVIDKGIYSGSSKSWPFMVMEKVEGSELRTLIEDGSLAEAPLSLVVGLAMEVLGALKAAHVHQVIHRDLKPDNIMITSRGHVKVMDFGIARKIDAHTLTRTGTAMGTPQYMSPEHLNAKQAGPPADIYSMGVILYEMLTGKRPFEAEDPWQVLVKMMAEEPVPIQSVRSDVPDDLAMVVMTMLERDTSLRYSSAEACLKALEPIKKRLAMPAPAAG